MTAGIIGSLVGAFGFGAALGSVYCGLLWLAVGSMTSSAWPVPLHMVAFCVQTLVRIGVVIGGLFSAILLGASAGDIALAAVGFAAARFTITAFIGRQGRERA